jgi:hypothetical protein
MHVFSVASSTWQRNLFVQVSVVEHIRSEVPIRFRYTLIRHGAIKIIEKRLVSIVGIVVPILKLWLSVTLYYMI